VAIHCHRFAGLEIAHASSKSLFILSAFAKNNAERSGAESWTRQVAGVKSVKNQIAVRP